MFDLDDLMNISCTIFLAAFFVILISFGIVFFDLTYGMWIYNIAINIGFWGMMTATFIAHIQDEE